MDSSKLRIVLLLLLPACKPSSPVGHDGGSAPEPSGAVAPSRPQSVSGQVIHLRADTVVSTDPVPASPLGHGEALRAIWTARDGTTFAVGYQYPGTPGRDAGSGPQLARHSTGAVYRRSPGGAWQLVYTKPGTELGRIWGRDAADVYAAGGQTLAHFDGSAWSEVTIPHLEGYLGGVWGDATDLWVCAGHQYTAHVYHRDRAGVWGVELKTDVILFNLGGAGSSVWAVGSSGAVFHRDAGGHWKQEREERLTQYTSVWASGESDVYVAGSDLRYSSGDGQWTKVELPTPAPVRYAWGRGKGDVFVGTAAGLFHLANGQWAKTGFTGDSAGASGTGDDVFVAHNELR